MRRLRVVPAGEGMLGALRDALGGGDAILPETPGLAAAAVPDRVERRVALVVASSGSTGTPKRVAISADALLANTGASESALGGPGQWLLALPTHYIAGINVLARSLAAGIDPVAVAPGPFTAAAFRDAAERMTAPDRFTSLVPAQLATLLDDAAARGMLARFRRVLVGGQALPAGLAERAADAGVPVTRSYGSSESSGGCVYDGVPIGQTIVRVVDGEVRLASPGLAEGYLGDVVLTRERFVSDDGVRWFRTADAGEWDGQRLVVTGRRDDVVISGGVKVSLGAVERLLRDHGIEDAVVVAGAHPRWGESPVAVTATAGDAEQAVAAVAAALGPAARPRIVRVSEIPLLPSGKPDRVRLRATVSD